MLVLGGVLGRRWRAGLAAVFASSMLATPAQAEPGNAAKLTDAILVRPLLIVPALLGTTLAIGLYPYDVIAGLDGRTTYYFLEVPVAYLRERPLGDFSTPQRYPLPTPEELTSIPDERK